MTDSELLIKIKTALEAGGIDAAKSKISELTQEIEKTKTADIGSNAERRKSIDLLNNLKGAANGNITSMTKLAGEATALGGALLFVSASAGAAMVGFQAGMKIGDWMWPQIMNLEGFDKTTGSIRDRVKELTKGLEDLNKVAMDKLLQNLAAVNDDLASIVNKTEGRQKRESLLTGEKQKAEMAEFDASWAGKDRGSEYERKRADLEKKHAEENNAIALKQITEKEKDLDQALGTLNIVRQEKRDAKTKAEESLEDARVFASSGGGSVEDYAAVTTAENALKEATKELDVVEKAFSKEASKIDRQFYDLAAQREAIEISAKSIAYKHQGAMYSADKTDRDAQTKSDQENFRRMSEQDDNARAGEIDDLKRQAGVIADRAKDSRRRADSYTGAAGLKGRQSRAAKAAADARDEELEQIALRDEADSLKALEVIHRMEATRKAEREAMKRLAEQASSQNSNLPI